VHIDFVSHRIPHPRLQGLTGNIIEKRGSSYVVQINVKGAVKKLSLRPEHLKKSG
jgi:large subunit ribosomal protein L21e